MLYKNINQNKMKKFLSRSSFLLCVLTLMIAQSGFVALAADEPPTIEDPFASEIGPTINSALSATGTVGSSFSYTITTAGTPPITYSASGLPAGLSLSGATISGTPTTAGSYSVVLTAQNDIDTDTKTLAITIQAVAAEPEPVAEPAAEEEEAPPALTLPPAEVVPEVPAAESAPTVPTADIPPAAPTAPAPTHAAAPVKATSVPIKSISKSGPEIIVLAFASALLGAGYRRFKKTK